MRFSEYIEKKNADGNKGELARIHRATGVSYAHLNEVANEKGKFSRYDVAKKIADETDGLVSVEELCTWRAA